MKKKTTKKKTIKKKAVRNRTVGAAKAKRKPKVAARRSRAAAVSARPRGAKTSARRKAPRGSSSEKARLERNKKIVLEFYDLAINKKDFAAASKYMAPRYVQHNPTAADGHDGLKAFLDWFKRDFPDLRAEIKRVIAEGDYVVLHVHGTRGPDPYGTAVIDVFRIEDGKVAEHWDVIQAIPAEIANPNGMF